MVKNTQPIPREYKRREKLKLLKTTRRSSDVFIEASEANLVDRIKTVQDFSIIRHALTTHFIFTSLTEESIEVIIANMMHYTIDEGKVLFAQDAPGKMFYVLMSGTMGVIINGNQVNIMQPGASFGELALLHGSPRSATILALESCSLWAVDRKTFRDAVQDVNTITYAENEAFINSVPLLQGLTPRQKSDIVYALTSHKFAPNTRIVNEGDPGDLMYLIKEGHVSCTKEGIEIHR